MNKKSLLSTFKKYENCYASLLKEAKAITNSTKWGAGALDPVSLEPYRIELLGEKPGKMLKGPSAPAKNRFLYHYDNEGRVVYAINYAELGGPPNKKEWIHFDNFYKYGNNEVFRFVFSSVLGDKVDAKLAKVIFIKTANNKVETVYCLDMPELEFTKTIYKYLGNGCISIDCTWPDGIYPTRKYMVEDGGENIFEVTDGVRERIYPKSKLNN